MSLTVLVFLLLLCLKHFIADGVLQTNWMALNKGDKLHIAGYVHAAIHAIFTALVLVHFKVSINNIALIFLIETVVHFWIDWSKVNLTKSLYLSKFDPTVGLIITDNKYFWWLVFDQCVHFATYCLLAYFLFYYV